MALRLDGKQLRVPRQRVIELSDLAVGDWFRHYGEFFVMVEKNVGWNNRYYRVQGIEREYTNSFGDWGRMTVPEGWGPLLGAPK